MSDAADDGRTPGTRSRSRWWRIGAVTLAVAVAAGAGWWAGRVTLTPAAVESTSPAAQVWTSARRATVGRSLPFSTTMRQPLRPVATNGLAGVVTETHAGTVELGSVLYRVGDVAVRAVQAPRPSWRDLRKDLRGDDVRALQELLASLGHFDGKTSGTFGGGTEAAVKAWQKAEGRPATGTVARGELVALPRLPMRVTLGQDIAQGKVLAGGEEAVRASTGEREFVMVLTEEQLRQVPAEATIEVSFEDHTWKAVVAETRQGEQGSYELVLRAPGGGEVCADACPALPTDPSLTLRSKVIVVPQVSGPAVPAAAVRADADGSPHVVTRGGRVPVTVLGSGQGLAVLEGIADGDEVLVGETAAQQGAPSPSPAPSETGR
ncbi:peptidoglycan-binding protein [uncultured Tessaracoccus sp.]|uniref:peptidoglycan-binding domain-containing protein n=1 Tax=uncultured Tessaracoccus sp. TaxID=905023 RepID=UPI0025ED2EAE|nr:peptidoglycan-binding domain-containing protein [uncultured Tessaracoccus sp.]